MADTPKHVQITVSSDELTKLQRAYEDRIHRQKERLTSLLAFLEHKKLVDEFNDWESKQGE